MSAYAIAEIDVLDPAAYEEYRAKVPATIAQYGGKYVARGGKTEPLEGGWTPKRQPDLTQVMFVMSGDLIEFLPQCAHAVYAMHELKTAAALIVHASIIDDGVANRFIYAPGDL